MTWEVKPLNKIGKIFSGNSINEKVKKEKYYNISEGFPYVATKDISYNYQIDYNNGVKIPLRDLNKFRIAHKNSILICSEGGSAGRKLAFNSKDICFVNKLFALEPFNFICPKYVFYFYNSFDFKKQFKSKMTGLIGGVSKNKFNEIKIPVPSLTEQKEIVKILDTAFEKIAKAKENAQINLKNSKEIFESYLNDVFENKGKDWEEKKLSDVCEVIAGQSPEGKYYNKNEKGLPFYQGKKEFTDKFIGKPTTWTTKVTKKAIKNDVLISVRAPVGPVNFAIQDICIGRGLASIRSSKKINSELLFYFLLNIQKKLIGNNGAVFNSINKTQIENITLNIPKSIEEQKKIISMIDNLSEQTKKLEEIYNKKLQSLEELKNSILEKAFKGELTKDIYE